MDLTFKDRAFRNWITLLLAACLSATASPQSTEKRKQTEGTPTPQITKFFIDQAPKDSGYETGPLHILYSDGTETVQTLPPLKPSTEKDIVFNAVGFSGVELAEDRQTLGWTINVADDTSHSIPFSVVVFRHKRVLHTFDTGRMVWSWMFLESGKQVAVVFGPTHGPEVGNYQLYDVKTGKLLAEVSGDEDTQSLRTDAPDWAKQLQNHFHGSP